MTGVLLGAAIAYAVVRPKRKDKDKILRLEDGTPRAQILFFHAQWCPACEKARPEIKKIQKRHPNILFTSIDIEKDPEAASTHHVTSLPTFIALIDGKEVDRREGFKEGTDLSDFVEATFSSQKAIGG